jgi:hypothetical protein
MAGGRGARSGGGRVERGGDRGAFGEGEIDGRQRQRLVLHGGGRGDDERGKAMAGPSKREQGRQRRRRQRAQETAESGGAQPEQKKQEQERTGTGFTRP